jgi:hypothetical protein
VPEVVPSVDRRLPHVVAVAGRVPPPLIGKQDDRDRLADREGGRLISVLAAPRRNNAGPSQGVGDRDKEVVEVAGTFGVRCRAESAREVEADARLIDAIPASRAGRDSNPRPED